LTKPLPRKAGSVRKKDVLCWAPCKLRDYVANRFGYRKFMVGARKKRQRAQAQAEE